MCAFGQMRARRSQVRTRLSLLLKGRCEAPVGAKRDSRLRDGGVKVQSDNAWLGFVLGGRPAGADDEVRIHHGPPSGGAGHVLPRLQSGREWGGGGGLKGGREREGEGGRTKWEMGYMIP